MSKKMSVTGLQNIGMLMERGTSQIKTPRVEKPFEPEEKRMAILKKTMVTLRREDVDPIHAAKYIKAAVAAAYTAGHDDALAQNVAVEELLAKQYQDRSANLVPAVVAAVMEQLGMTTLTLDLAAVATVFKRTRLEFTVIQGLGDIPDVAEYRLEFNGDAQ